MLSRRLLSWELLCKLQNLDDRPWVVFGDFNEVLYSYEIRGGRENWQMQNFRDALERCGLFDLGCEGYPFTFSNRRQGEHHVQARLDRVVVNLGWRQLFPRARVRNILDPEDKKEIF
ncbi:hypothetical protein QQ045_012475 [Rhodiola kirilowii]